MTAAYQKHDAIAVITLNNPPVNGLGHATRSGIVEGINKALEDDTGTTNLPRPQSRWPDCHQNHRAVL